MESDTFQTLLIGLQDRELTVEEEYLLTEYCPGGVILFNHNVSSPDQVAGLCTRIRKLCRIPPLIAVDQEGGVVSRLRDLLTADVSPTDLMVNNDPGRIRQFGRITGELLAALGINLNLAPVVDLRVSEADNALKRRYWGGDAEEVSERAGAYLKGLQETGVFGCLKHFPGLGRAQVDPHRELPEVPDSLETLISNDMVPFADLAGGASFVMVAHCRYSAIDGGDGPPSSCSPSVYRLLREEIGFNGVAVTDDLEMGALDVVPSLLERMNAALGAGADMIPICNDPKQVMQAFDLVKRIAEKELVPRERIDEAAGRIKKAKQHLPLEVKPDPELAERFRQLDEQLAQLLGELRSNEE